jgi:hypothetical protein
MGLLQNNYKYNGIIIPSVYHRIKYAHFDRNSIDILNESGETTGQKIKQSNIKVMLYTYQTKYNSDNNINLLCKKAFNFSDDSIVLDNITCFIGNLYIKIKLKDEFCECIDV